MIDSNTGRALDVEISYTPKKSGTCSAHFHLWDLCRYTFKSVYCFNVSKDMNAEIA